MTTAIDFSPVVSRMQRDVKTAAATLTPREARYLVDAYYQFQDNRMRASGQVRSMSRDQEPHEALAWLSEQGSAVECRIKSMLDVYSDSQPIGRWSRGIVGIGPVLASGLLAHIEIEQAPTVGHIWRFAGLDPTQTWEKGKKRPWNAQLKVICWKIGEQFVMVQNKTGDVYGTIYADRKLYECLRNERGELADQAAAKLKRCKIGKQTEAYKHYSKGKLPPAHIHARAKRYAVKLFLAHWHDRAFRIRYGHAPPLPYPIAHLGHTHMIDPPE